MIAVAHQDDLRRVIEQLGVRLGDIEAAEGVGGSGRQQQKEENGDGNGETFHVDTSG